MASLALTPARRDGWTLNPLRMLFALYLAANLYAFATLLMGLPIDVDTEQFTFPIDTVIPAAIALFGTLFACLLAFRLAATFSKPGPNMAIGARGGWVLLAIQVAYIAYNLYYGTNVAGVEDENPGNPAARLFFSLTQPDLLFLIVGVGLSSRRLFWANAFIYTLSLLLRSWIGGLYLLALIVALREYPLHIDRRSARRLILLLLAGVLALPLIVSGKWFLRSGASLGDALDFLSDIGYGTYLMNSVGYVANRFQHLGHVCLIFQNSVDLHRAFEEGRFISYWMDAAPQWLMLRVSGIEIVTFNKYMVQSLFASNNFAYASNPGLAGWLFVLRDKSILMVFYFLLVTVLPALLIRRGAGQKYFLLVGCFSLVYLFHGWIGAYANLLLFLLAIVFSKRILTRRRSRSVVETASRTRGSLGPTLG